MIPSSGTPTVTSTLTIQTPGIIDDLDVVDLIGTHSYISDLTVKLTSPAGTQVTLWSSICGSQDNFDVNFDDEATSATLPCPPTGGGTYIPNQSLSAFDGENMAGVWTLTIIDSYNQDGGSLTSWGLDICTMPNVLYVDPANGNNSNTGSYSSPLKSIPTALNLAAQNSIPTVYVKSGTYNFTSSINISTASSTKITLSPEPNGYVKFNLGSFRNFRFYQGANNIEVKGFEFDGNSNRLDHWTLLSQYVWQPASLPDSLAGGGIAIQIEDAQNIQISDNYIHDFYQKAVNIEDGRYVTVRGNIIHRIAQTSLSGGHGIMRQQGSGSFSTPDDTSKYRWDIDGNLLFNVHQRIYSWVPSKGYLNMTLDEGKSILIDETPNHDVNMKARIRNNIVAYGKVDAIRLKPTNGLSVLRNSVFATDSHADGITNTTNGFNSTLYGTPFLNFKAIGNAVEVSSLCAAYQISDALSSTGATPTGRVLRCTARCSAFSPTPPTT